MSIWKDPGRGQTNKQLPRGFFRRFRLIVDISDSVSVRFLFAKQGILSDIGISRQLGRLSLKCMPEG